MWSDPSELCHALMDEGRVEEAVSGAHRAVVDAQERFGAKHTNVGLALLALGDVLLAVGRGGDARAPLSRAAKILDDDGGLSRLRAAEALDLLGLAHEEKGELEQAEKSFRQALAIRERELGDDHPDVASSLDLIARLYSDGRLEDERAEPLLRRALYILDRAGPAWVDRSVRVLHNLGVLCQRERRLDDAQRILERAVDLSVEARGPEDPAIAPTLRDLACICGERGDLRSACALCRDAVAIIERSNGEPSEDLTDCLAELAELERRLGHDQEALSLYRRALAARRALGGPDDIEAAELEDWIEELEHPLPLRLVRVRRAAGSAAPR